ncbi:signal recognition particle-docking protein FtsY [Synechococcales cyanobacterium C]|uniref:Signal recognition particle receptor FtsY n=1 Tax=Petrachloros mirabilis ULC683 TaxID=2781853 RepID=A0A8K1ZZS8_9CYAN|nr:signal recognition particle-docking protein FtsY [Petrachloros mirabilis]NCJ06727.1 signal recognition particle-docking protein FtsY [Petrachloros mirabilis ULC683]
MVFNWFRRQYNPDDEVAEDTPPSVQGAAVAPKAAEITSGATAEADPETDPEDYLNWAKTAYQNIQQRQLGTELPPLESDADEAEISGAEALELTATAPTAPSEETELIAPPEAAHEASESQAQATKSTPLWARSEVERQDRLERLKSNAIAPAPMQSESLAQPSAQTQPPTPTRVEAVSKGDVETEMTFDEGFIWSAEVLAAQGRRPEDISVEEITWLQKLRRGLDKTRRGLVNQLKAVVGQGPLNADAVLEIEALLLQADVGIEATDTVIQALQEKLRQEALPPDAAIAYLKQILQDILDRPIQSGQYHAQLAPEKGTLTVWLMTGVNGAGKTTTIGKIAHVATQSGYSCLIAAADTFRAAAVEQVKIWGQRSQVDVVANPGKNTDPAAVVFDAISAAQSRGIELLLVDTAGRLQNKKNLMDELSKVRRILDKKAPQAHIESLLVLDATLGQNGLRQAQVFSEAAQLTGVVLTKLDGTAKGGVALAVVQQLGLPIRFIGAGEGIQDLRPFSSYEFVEALLSS